jgi:murein L,D-transpeptidase YcbB/YkuD
MVTLATGLLHAVSAIAADTDAITDKVEIPRSKTAALTSTTLARGATVEPQHAAGARLGDAPDTSGVDILFDRPRREVDLSGLDPADWAPEHATRGDALPRQTRELDKGVDPEPDTAIKAPSPSPSRDPLDRTTPVVQPLSASPQPPALPGRPTVQAPEPLPALDAAIKAALDKRDAVEIRGAHATEKRKEREAVAFFYAAHGFAPAWSEGGKPVAAVASVLARLALAGEDALNLPSPPKNLQTIGKVEDLAESDVALTEAVVAYARQATGSRIDPYSISPLIGAKPDLADPAEVVDGLIASGLEAGDKLQSLNPTDPRYVALRQKLAEIHAARVPNVAAPIPPGPTLRVGMRDARVPLIRSRFSLGATADSELDDLKYDTEVAAAIADFQRANGLRPSGQLNKRTIAALSGGEPARLENTIVANMEMWRWMPHDLGRDRIEVNVPEFVVKVFHAGQPVAEHRVVVGKTSTPTPLFSNTMKYLIVNPVWNVPESIVQKEFIPKSGGDPGYLESHGFDVSYRHGQLVVKQPAGAKNALGRIKFMFPNDYSVYLHDTPSKSLFAASKRAFSHGCVRVDQPFGFAESVLNDGVPEGGKIPWSQKRLQAMLGSSERYVYLPEPLPIHIEYFTAVVDGETGHLELHDDVYDYVRRVAAVLAQDS